MQIEIPYGFEQTVVYKGHRTEAYRPCKATITASTRDVSMNEAPVVLMFDRAGKPTDIRYMENHLLEKVTDLSWQLKTKNIGLVRDRRSDHERNRCEQRLQEPLRSTDGKVISDDRDLRCSYAVDDVFKNFVGVDGELWAQCNSEPCLRVRSWQNDSRIEVRSQMYHHDSEVDSADYLYFDEIDHLQDIRPDLFPRRGAKPELILPKFELVQPELYRLGKGTRLMKWAIDEAEGRLIRTLETLIKRHTYRSAPYKTIKGSVSRLKHADPNFATIINDAVKALKDLGWKNRNTEDRIVGALARLEIFNRHDLIEEEDANMITGMGL